MYGNKLKSIIFTYDAIVSLSLILIFIFGIFLFYYDKSNVDSLTFIREHSQTYLAEDMITILETYPFSSLPIQLRNNISLSLDIPTNLLNNKSISEIIVLLWSKNDSALIKNLVEFLFPPNNIRYNYNLSIVTSSLVHTVYSTSNKTSSNVVKSFSFVTGYEENKKPLGYVAKAFATKIRKTTTLVFPISPEGAGNRGGWLTITKKFYFPGYHENVTNAIFYISIHTGWDDSDFETLKINDNNIKDDVVWLWKESVSTGSGVFGYVNITPYIHHGWNTLIMRFRNPPYNAHIHPGSRIEITYRDDKFFNGTAYVSKYLYYEDVYSQEQSNRGTGAWATFEYYVPLKTHLNNVTFHLSLKDIEDVGWWWSWEDWRWYNWDVRVYVNGNLIDEIYEPKKNMSLYYNITSLSHPGTNYIVVYANTYGDDFTGEDYTEIYCDPQNDPEGSTYIYVNYSYDKSNLMYGKIDLTVSQNLGGDKENPKTYAKYLDSTDILSSFLHVAQMFSDTIDVFVWSDSTSTSKVFSSHLPRGIPSTIYIDPSYYNIPDTNYIKMEDTCSGCDYLPQSSFEYSFLIPSHVGYGDVFPSEKEAIDDAINRLKNVLGKYVNATEIKNSTARIGNIPYLYGPVKLEVSVW